MTQLLLKKMPGYLVSISFSLSNTTWTSWVPLLTLQFSAGSHVEAILVGRTVRAKSVHFCCYHVLHNAGNFKMNIGSQLQILPRNMISPSAWLWEGPLDGVIPHHGGSVRQEGAIRWQERNRTGLYFSLEPTLVRTYFSWDQLWFSPKQPLHSLTWQ